MINQNDASIIIKDMLNRGATYAEIYYESKSSLSYSNIDNKRQVPYYGTSKGLAIRIFKGKEVLFQTTNDFSKENLLKISEELLGKVKKDVDFKFKLIDEKHQESDSIDKLFFKESKTRTNVINKSLKDYSKQVKTTNASFKTSKTTKIIANSNGNFVGFDKYVSSVTWNVVTFKNNDQESMNDKISKAMTFEDFLKFIDQDQLQEKIIQTVKVALELLDAPQMENGVMPVILPSGFGAVLFHEACGHPLEASSIAKNLSTYANKVGKQVASKLVTLVDDAMLEYEVGSSPYDDEGQKTERKVLIENGILKKYLIDTYHGNEYMNTNSNGSGRRESYRYIPTSRMSNTFILKGNSKVDDIIKNTKYGFYAKRLGGGQVDPFSGNFNFGVIEGYVIKDGKISHLVKPTALVGNGIEALLKVDMIADDFEISPGVCGASSGMIPVTVGQPTLRVSSMTVGGK